MDTTKKPALPVPNLVPASPHFAYRDGVLCVDGAPLTAIAERFGTPSYVYSGAAIDGAYAAIDASLAAAPHFIAYAMKANSNLAVLQRLARAGAGADIVSGGELARALKAGFEPGRIVFSGVGKTDAELETALEVGVRSIHAESEQEIDVIESVARAVGKRAPLGLRVNPDVDPKTHPYISTGLRSAKFGLEIATARKLLPRLIASPHLELESIACHVGSMVSSPEPIGEAFEIVARFARECLAAGARMKAVDSGGGFPIDYGDDPTPVAAYARFGRAITDALVRAGADQLGLQVMVEPGRSIVGDAGILLARVLYTKEQAGKRFVIVDAAMTELIRPALYGAYHAIMPVAEPVRGAALSPADVVGPVCESGDFLARGRELPELVRGDLIAIRGAGAYSAAMGSRYNSRPFAAEVMVDSGAARLVRKRETVEALWREEVID